jgi:hypothetical protein
MWFPSCCCWKPTILAKKSSFYISSPGGSVTSGMVVYDTMRMIKSPVSTICMGLAASMGSILLSAGEKGKRFIYPHGEVMIHQPSLGGHVQGVSADMEIHAEQILRTRKWAPRCLADNTGPNDSSALKKTLSATTGWMRRKALNTALWIKLLISCIKEQQAVKGKSVWGFEKVCSSIPLLSHHQLINISA